MEDTELVCDEKDIIENIKQYEYDLKHNRDELFGCIKPKSCSCFIRYLNEKDEVRFIPSKYVGYKNNNIDDHYDSLWDRDGRETNAKLDKIFKEKHKENTSYDDELIDFFKGFEIELKKYEKKSYKFWNMKISDEVRTYNITNYNHKDTINKA